MYYKRKRQSDPIRVSFIGFVYHVHLLRPFNSRWRYKDVINIKYSDRRSTEIENKSSF